ncbi:MAG: acyl-CoA dehydrogenase [Polaromonas sp.]|uniref:acyl-CoA dehydrogenase n=1 Tax=Polaromonas sp. TaxID=1869339 RepID=UPI002489B19D|nr:acyl-CoA dehydrogenase [Polaromonas sp.]MDI1240000.1 acyl-CoA dehydrogenase [Polaromonas sp.]
MTLDLLAAGDSSELRMVRESARALLTDRWPPQQVLHEPSPQAFAALWHLAAEQGWTAVEVDGEELDGLSTALVLLQEFGRASCPLPLLDSVLLNAALKGCAAANATAVRDALGKGQMRPTWTWDADSGEAGALTVSLERPDAQPLRLNGRAAFVENAQTCTHLLVPTGGAREIAIVAINAPGVSVLASPGLSRPALSEVTLDGVTQFELVQIGCDLATLIPVARVLLAARALGAAAFGLELLTGYAKERKQFGQFIGQYQAIQHKLTNCLMGIEICRLSLQATGEAEASRRPYAAAVAASNAGGVLRHVALELLHGFGGIGFWEEHAMPQLFRRVHSDVTRLGGVHAARRILGAQLLEAPVGTRMPDPVLGAAVDDFRKEVRGWLETNWDHCYPQASAHLPVNHQKARQDFSRQLGRQGWLGVSWPREYGGQQRGALEQMVFEEEMAYAEAPVTFHNTAANMIGPALITHGSPDQKAYYLPGIARGDISFALGYSEPDHGSDLAGLRTAATRTPDGGWRVRGQKTFTSTAGFSTHLWLAARTDPDNARHGGISVFIVPLDAPGLTMHPMMGLNGHRANTVFLDDVQLPADALVGLENGGWKIITDALAYERASLAGIAARARGYFDQMLDHLRAATVDGRPAAGDPLVRDRVGELTAQIESARLLAIQTAEIIQRGLVPQYEAAISKVYGSELMERLAEAAFDLLGTGAALERGCVSALVDGRFEYAVRDAPLYTIGGGTNEIQRTLIALRGLGLPR